MLPKYYHNILMLQRTSNTSTTLAYQQIKMHKIIGNRLFKYEIKSKYNQGWEEKVIGNNPN